MIDTNKIRGKNYSCGDEHAYGVIRELCDEVDRRGKLYGESRNGRLAAQNMALKFGKEIQQLQEIITEKDKRIDALLTALVVKGE